MLMKNNFQSKSVPRGTRTIWRYLSALILLFSLSIGQMWADQTDLISDVTLPDVPASSLDMSSQTTFTPDANGWIVMQPNADVRNKDYTWFTAMAWNTSSQSISDVSSFTAPFYTLSSVAVTTVQKTGRTKAIRFTGATDISFLVHSGGSRTIYVSLYTLNTLTSAQSLVETKSQGNAWGELLFSGLSNANTYVAYMYESTNSNGYVAEIAIKKYTASGPVDPTLTFNDGAYTIGGADLDLSTLVSASNSDGAITYSVKSDPDGTGASISGTTFIADAPGTVVVTASQAATSSYNAKSVDFNVVVSEPVTPECPSVSGITGWEEYDQGQPIELTVHLTAGNGDITYTWYKSATNDLATAKAGGAIATGAVYSKAHCELGDEGFYFCVATKDACSESASTGFEIIAVHPLTACAELYPATSGASPTAANQEIILQTEAPNASFGGKIYTHSAKSGDFAASFTYTANGIQLNKGGDDKMRVELTHLMQVGTTITVTLVNPDASKARGFKLCNASGTAKATWQETTTDPYQKTYTVVAGDGLAGSNIFILQRAESSALKDLKVSNCGDELFELSSAVDPAGEATVTLSNNLLVAGGSATATYTISNPLAYDFDEWEITSGDATIADIHAATAAITMGTSAATITLKLKAASVKHTVTYYDENDNNLGEELVVEGQHPVGLSITPRKLGYTFAGWGTSKAGPVVAFSDVTVNADMPLYTIWNEIDCSAQSGTIYSMSITVPPAQNCTIKTASGFESTLDLFPYGGIVGGEAMLSNTGSSNNCILQSDGKIVLKDNVSCLKLDFDCPLKEGDKIRSNISGNTAWVSADATRPSGTSTALAVLASNAAGEFVIPAASDLIGLQTIYIWKGGGNTTITSINIYRPAHFAVTFNMHDHGDAVDPQSVVEGGKVTKPTDPTASGWDFGGWFTDDTYGTTWDFENMTISAATEIHALWTVHTTSSDATLSSLTVNGEAITLEDGVFDYAFELPMGTTALPTIVAVPNDSHSKGVSVVQSNIDLATITVTAEDDSFQDYTISFTVATSKDIELVWDKSKQRCDATTPDANVLIAAMSQYLSASYTGSAAEGGSLTTGKTTGSKIIITAKPGYAFKAMGFYGKIEDGTCNFYNDGVVETIGTTTGDACYADVFSNDEVHEFIIELTGTNGVYIRNMQLTMIEACTPIVVAWDEEPVEFEVGKAGYAIAATANNGGAITYASADNTVIDVNASTGALTIAGLGSVALSASTPEGDGTTYCANGGDPIVLSKTVNTYYLVAFDGQNGEAADEVKYFSGDAAIAQPTDPSFPGHTFQGWFDAASAGNPVAFPLTPSASRTIYAQWTADCAGATITTQPEGTSYLTGRTATALVCEATAGAGGALTYEWFTCDDAMRTNPVAATATPSTAVAGTFYYFCKVTEEGCAVEAFSDVATIVVADKDPICLIATTVTGATAHGAVTGFLGEDRGGDAEVNVTGGSYKMDKGKYIGVTLPDGYKFQEGDKVVLNVMTVNNATGFTLFDGKDGEKNLIIDTRDGALVPAGANTVVLPAYAGSQSVYVMREDNSTTGDLNSAIDAIAVYRACAPILNKVTVNGAEGKPNALKEVVFEVAASTTQSQLEAIAFDWVSNDDAWTVAHAPVAANAWEFGVANEVTFTDKDGDQSVYTITVNKAAASTNVELATLTVNGNAVTVVPGQAVYNYELPYGTSAAPVVAATAEDANAEVGTITQAASATGSATFTVTAEDGTTTRDYTINFSVSKWKEVVIWDGSYMSAVTTSPDATTGMAWTVNGFSSITNYNATCGTKAYTKTLPSGGGASTTRNVAFTVPAGYVAKFYIAFGTHSDGNNRGMFIGSNATKTLDATSVLTLYSNSRTNLTDGTSEIVGAGTYYLNPMESVDFYEIRAYLRPGYVRTEMLGNGVLGTVCVDHNVAIEDIQGATFYELMGRDYDNYGKLAFDEITAGELEAGAPYVFQAHGDKLVLFYGETSVADPVDKGNGMYGTFSAITLTELDDVYYFAQRALWSCVDLSSLSVPANRAYVMLSEVDEVPSPTPAPGRRRILMGVNGETQAQGFDNLESGDAPVKVMIDGTLYILRGEKVFDATGRLVK